MTIQANEAQKPNPALKAFEMLIGEWGTEGAHPLVPSTVFHGRATIDWIEGGAFLRIRTQIDEPEIPSGISIIGSDDVEGTFYMLYFDERGISRKYDVSLSGHVLTWERIDPEFSQRMILTIADDGATISQKGEMKRGAEWEPDLELIYTKQ